MQRLLVKALVSRAGQSPSARYVPLEVFELWKSHMNAAYGYQVVKASTGTWDPARIPPGEPDAPAAGEPVSVVLVSRIVSGIPTQVERFFLDAELEMILPRFLSHYGIDPDQTEQLSKVRIVQGLMRPLADSQDPVSPGISS